MRTALCHSKTRFGSRGLHPGSLITPATWIRNFVRSHPAYKFDSVVSQEINYDLFVAVDEMCVASHRAYDKCELTASQ